MAVAWVARRGSAQNKTGETATAVTVASVTLGSRLVVFIAADDTSVTSVTDNQSNTYALDAGPATNAANVELHIYSAKITSATAPTTVTVNWGASTTAKAIACTELSGTADTGHVGSTETATGNGTAITTPTTLTVGADDLGFGFAGCEAASGNISAVNAPWSDGSDGNVGTSGAGAASNINQRYQWGANGESGNCNQTQGSADWAAIAIVYKAPAAATAAPRPISFVNQAVNRASTF